MAVVAAADIAPKAFEQLVREGGENQDVEDDLQVSLSPDRLRDRLVQCCETVFLNMLVIGVALSMAAGRLWLWYILLLLQQLLIIDVQRDIYVHTCICSPTRVPRQPKYACSEYGIAISSQSVTRLRYFTHDQYICTGIWYPIRCRTVWCLPCLVVDFKACDQTAFDNPT